MSDLTRAVDRVLAAARLALSAESRSVEVWVAWIRAAAELRAAEREHGRYAASVPDEDPTRPDIRLRT